MENQDFDKKVEEARILDGHDTSEIVEEDSFAPIEEIVEEIVEEVVEEKSSTEKIIIIKDGDKVFEISENALLNATTQDGRSEDVSLAELRNDVWGKQEIHRRLNEISNKKDPNEKYKDLLNLIESKDGNITGFDKIYTLLEEAHRLNPELADDIEAFATKMIEGSSMSEEHRDSLKTKQENARLKKDLDKKEQQTSNVEIDSYINDQAQGWLSELKIDSDSFSLKASELEKSGELQNITTKKSVDQALAQVASAVLEDRIVNALSLLNLTEEENSQAIKKSWGLLQADLTMTKDQLSKDLGALFSKTPSVAKKAKERVEKLSEEVGHRPEAQTPKPLTSSGIETELDFEQRINKRLGKLN